MVTVIMPKMGDGMEEGTLLEWLKKQGETVSQGEIIGTIQTDKATLELEAPGNGVLDGLLIHSGETVPVGVPIAAILVKGESLPIDWGQKENLEKGKQQASPVINSFDSNHNQDENARVKATPLARKIAREHDVDLFSVQGTGIGGRIVEKDVLSTVKPTTQVSIPQPVLLNNQEDVMVPLSRLRQIIGQRTLQAKQQVPHFYVTVEVDLEKILAFRDWVKKEQSANITVNDFIIKASALALREMPIVNSSIHDGQLLQHPSVHVGMAVASDEGLFVPVVKNADQLSLKQIASESKRLGTKARDNRLSPEEMQGSTFSISNMGMLDVDHFIAIINVPNAAILAVSTAKKIPVVIDDQIQIRTRMNLTGSFDHRVLDGAVAAKFINRVRFYLENPTHLMN